MGQHDRRTETSTCAWKDAKAGDRLERRIIDR